MQDRQERDSWKNGVTLHIALDPALGVKSNSLRAIFDRKHAPDAAEMDRATQDVLAGLRKDVDKAQAELDSSGVPAELKQKYLQALKDNFDASSVIESADPSAQAALKGADQALTQSFSNRLSALDHAGLKRLSVEPVKIQNSMIELQSDGIALHYLVLDR